MDSIQLAQQSRRARRVCTWIETGSGGRVHPVALYVYSGGASLQLGGDVDAFVDAIRAVVSAEAADELPWTAMQYGMIRVGLFIEGIEVTFYVLAAMAPTWLQERCPPSSCMQEAS